MKKITLLAALVTAVLLSVSCTSTGGIIPVSSGSGRVQSQAVMDASPSTQPYHVIRSSQLSPIPAGSVVGIVSTTGPDALSIFMTAALEAKGLKVREMNLYSLLPPNLQGMTDPAGRYTFTDSLVRETVNIIKTTASADAEEEDTEGTVDLDALIDRMFTADDLVTEKQRIDHYLNLRSGLVSMIDSLNVEYILVAGSPYDGLSYALKIYDAETLDLVYSNIVISNEEEWRKVIPVPQKGDHLSYNFEEEKEPYAFWDLSYAEYTAAGIEIE